LIATFARKESLSPLVGSVGFHNLSETLASSHYFAFGGQTFNFKSIAPHGITFTQFISSALLSGSTDNQYPVAFAAVGTTTAIGGREPDR